MEASCSQVFRCHDRLADDDESEDGQPCRGENDRACGGVGDDDTWVSADPKDGVEPWDEQTGHENDRQRHRQRAPAGNRCVLAGVSAAAGQTVAAKDDQPAE